MPFAGRDFLTIATALATNVGDEAAERTAVSRAYYAAFHEARNYCNRTDTSISNRPSAHAEVRRQLSQTGRIGQDLGRLQRLRKNADYDIPFPTPNLSEEVQTALALARRILADLDALS
jgi:uncharacterized protein (UPF0332 family)